MVGGPPSAHIADAVIEQFKNQKWTQSRHRSPPCASTNRKTAQRDFLGQETKSRETVFRRTELSYIIQTVAAGNLSPLHFRAMIFGGIYATILIATVGLAVVR
jgi:hypothetical protein